MSAADLTGNIVGDIISVRFAFSGKIAKVNISPGDIVNRQQILASLDRTQLQVELDRELKDYERIRAEFEIFVRKQGSDMSDLARFEKIRQQSYLDVSVKAVELAKSRLDQADLVSPVDGTVISDGGLRPGLNITPGAGSVEILDHSSLIFVVTIGWDRLSDFSLGAQYRISLAGVPAEIQAEVLPFIPPVDGKKPPSVRFRPHTDLPLLPGQPGTLAGYVQDTR